MGQSFPPEDVFMGRGKSPCCSLLRTSIWDENQTEFHSICFSIFPGGWWGGKAEGVGQISGSVPFCVLLWKLDLWVCMRMWGHLARFISLYVAVHTCFLSGSFCFLSCRVCGCRRSISCLLEKKCLWFVMLGDLLWWWLKDFSLLTFVNLRYFLTPLS